MSAPAGPTSARTWRFDPWREAPSRAALAATAAFAGCVLVVALRPGALPALGLCLLVVASLAPAFVPVTCLADAEGVEVRGPLGTRRRAWRELRRLDVLPRAALLSPYPVRHLLDAQRAITLPLPGAVREEMLARFREELDRRGG